jgi:hypothetical protein
MDSLKKLDAVAANKIWVERLKTEAKNIRINEEFRINPKLLKKNRMVRTTINTLDVCFLQALASTICKKIFLCHGSTVSMHN